MSWAAYVKSMHDEGCMYAGFFSLKGDKWAETECPCLSVSTTQVLHVVQALKSPETQVLRMNGVQLGDKKFLVVDQTDTSVVLKQLGGESKVMACLALFNTGICMGVSAAGEREKCSRIAAEKCAEHLRGYNL